MHSGYRWNGPQGASGTRISNPGLPHRPYVHLCLPTSFPPSTTYSSAYAFSNAYNRNVGEVVFVPPILPLLLPSTYYICSGCLGRIMEKSRKGSRRANLQFKTHPGPSISEKCPGYNSTLHASHTLTSVSVSCFFTQPFMNGCGYLARCGPFQFKPRAHPQSSRIP